jgi:isoleucyl-tRNA synthetase
LPFTAEEAWTARFGDAGSVHLTLFPDIPAGWRDEALAEKWAKIREQRGKITYAIEEMRRNKTIGSSLQAVAVVPQSARALMDRSDDWADVCITSRAVFEETEGANISHGAKCERCWRVLEEVGTNAAHPTLCVRCCEAVEA